MITSYCSCHNLPLDVRTFAASDLQQQYHDAIDNYYDLSGTWYTFANPTEFGKSQTP